MPRYLTFALLMLGFHIPALLVGAAQSNVPPLHVGDLLPQLSGQTLTKNSLELPAPATGKPSVVVFTFSRAAGKDAHL